MSPESTVRGVAALSAHRFLMRAAFAASNAFAWVFAFQYFFITTGDAGYALAQTALLYAVSQVITALMTPFAAHMLRYGVRRMVRWGTILAAMGLVFWGASLAGYFELSIRFGIVAFALCMGAYRAFYWIPYTVERMEHPRSGRNVPLEFFVALMPLIAGVSLTQDPVAPVALLFGAASVILVALLPLIHVPERREQFVWGYRETFGELLEPKYRSYVSVAFFDGVQGAGLLLMWPLAVFILVDGSYTVLGLVLTITLLLAIPMRALGVRILPRMPTAHALLAASSWILRLVVATPVGIILVDSYASLGSPISGSGDRYALEQGADNGTYIDEFTALKEISLALGRLCMCAFVVVAAISFGLTMALAGSFVIAALASAYAVYRTRVQELV